MARDPSSDSKVELVERLEDLPEEPPDAEYVVVDVITSTTTVVYLLDSGARSVVPFADRDAALEFGERDDALVLGEEGGLPVDGFDGVPMPSVVDDLDVEGRDVGLYTTNGTRAVDRVGRSEGVYAASTVNAAAVADELRGGDEVWLVAAGRMSTPAPEDTAGARLIRMHLDGGPAEDDLVELRRSIEESSTAEWIRDLGLGDDLEIVYDFDSTETVPKLEDGAFVSS